MCNHLRTPSGLRVVASLSGLWKGDAVAGMAILYTLSILWKNKLTCQVASLWQWGQESENPLRTAKAAQGNVEASVPQSVTNMWGHFRPPALPEDFFAFLPFVSQ